MATQFTGGRFQALSASGVPIVGGMLYTYVTGTTTPQATYTDASLTTPNTNPVVLDARGEGQVWLGTGLTYRFVLNDSFGNSVWSVDGIQDLSAVSAAIYSTFSGSGGAALVGFLQSGIGAVARTQESKDKDLVDLGDFLPVGRTIGDTGDFTAIINAADAAAHLLGKALHFPGATYKAYGLLPKAPWYSREGATILNINPSGSFDGFVKVASTSGISSWICNNITFDGAASADPAPWNSGNFDSFTGSIGLYLQGLTWFSLYNVGAKNVAKGAGIRVESCSHGTIDRANISRCRGKFGDGIYMNACNDVRVLNASITDFTRIGIVSENGSQNIVSIGCYCAGGHDGSVMYGSTEYNAGIWYENSTNCSAYGCTSVNNIVSSVVPTQSQGYRHFVSVSNVTMPSGYAGSVANFEFESCTAYGRTGGSDIGFYASPSTAVGAVPMVVKRSKCSAFSVLQGFRDDAATNFDIFENELCHVDMPILAGVGTQIAYMWGSVATTGLPLFRYLNCTFSYQGTPDQASLDDLANNNTGTFSCFAGGRASVHIIGARGSDSTAPIYIKQRTGSLDIYVENTACVLGLTSVTGRCRLVDAQVYAPAVRSFANGTGDFESVSTSYLGPFQIAMTGAIKIVGGDITMPGISASDVRVVRTSVSKEASLELDGIHFHKDITAGTYVFRVDENSATFKPTAIIRNCTFYNVGAASGGPFVNLSTAGQTGVFAGCFYDANVTNPLSINAVGSVPTGMTAVTMH